MEIERLEDITNKIKEEDKLPTNPSVPKPEIKPNYRGTVTVRKKSLVTRFLETFFKGDLTNVKQFVFKDVIIPSLQDLGFDMVTKGLSMWLYDDTRLSKKSASNGTYTSYGDKYKGWGRNEPVPDKPKPSRSSMVDEHVFTVKEDAVDAQNIFYEWLEDYKIVRVSWYREQVGEEILNTDWNWGWDNLNDMKIFRTRDGWVLRMPPPKPIEK